MPKPKTTKTVAPPAKRTRAYDLEKLTRGAQNRRRRLSEEARQKRQKPAITPAQAQERFGAIAKTLRGIRVELREVAAAFPYSGELKRHHFSPTTTVSCEIAARAMEYGSGEMQSAIHSFDELADWFDKVATATDESLRADYHESQRDELASSRCYSRLAEREKTEARLAAIERMDRIRDLCEDMPPESLQRMHEILGLLVSPLPHEPAN